MDGQDLSRLEQTIALAIVDGLREGLPSRRERIATAAVTGLMSGHYAELFGESMLAGAITAKAVEIADALVVELEKGGYK